MCKELDMVFNPKLNYSKFSPVVNKEFVRIESGLGVADRDEYKAKYNCEYKAPCYHCPNIEKIKQHSLSIEGLIMYNEYIAPTLKK